MRFPTSRRGASAALLRVLVTALLGASTACGGGGGGGGSSAALGGGGIAVGAGPVVSALTPSSAAPGAVVAIDGTGLASASGAPIVRFGTTQASLQAQSATRLEAIVPGLPPGPADVTVTTGGATSAPRAFTVLAPAANSPVLTGLQPASGPAGTVVTLLGSNLGGVTLVRVGGASAVVGAGPSFTMPALPAGPAAVVAEDAQARTSAPATFTVTPVLTSVNPASALPGASITITGSNLGTAAVEVRFGASATVQATPSSGGTSITVAVPSPFPGALPAALNLAVAVNPAKLQLAVSNGLAFTVQAPASPQAASVSTLSPGSGPAGTIVTASGTGFGGAPTVTVGGVTAAVSASTASSATFAVPAGLAAGAAGVIVTGPGGPSAPITFTVTAPSSGVSLVSIDPPGGSAGQLVTLRGAGFGAAMPTITFGGVAASQILTFNDASAAVRVPAGTAQGAVTVVLTPAGGGASNGRAFTVATRSSASPGTFVATGSMSTPRCGPTATLLEDGRVLVAGGAGSASLSDPGLASAEVYDPATGQFTAVANAMTVPRISHTATRLPDGRVLVAGGFGDPGGGTSIYFSTDLYDPATNRFTAGPNMIFVRDGHTATPLASGDVLMAGGEGVLAAGASAAPIATVEVYRYQAGGPGSFQSKASLGLARLQSGAAPSFGGAIIIGGQDAQSELASIEVYDQVQNTWTRGPQGNPPLFIMTMPRVLPGVVRLASGDILAVGGFSPSAIAPLVSGGFEPWETFDYLDTSTGTFSLGGLGGQPGRVGHTTTLLANDEVLLTGSALSLGAARSASRLNATASSIGATGQPTVARFDHAAVLLFDGRVLVVGGGGDASGIPGVNGISLAATASAELYRP